MFARLRMVLRAKIIDPFIDLIARSKDIRVNIRDNMLRNGAKVLQDNTSSVFAVRAVVMYMRHTSTFEELFDYLDLLDVNTFLTRSLIRATKSPKSPHWSILTIREVGIISHLLLSWSTRRLGSCLKNLY